MIFDRWESLRGISRFFNLKKIAVFSLHGAPDFNCRHLAAFECHDSASMGELRIPCNVVMNAFVTGDGHRVRFLAVSH